MIRRALTVIALLFLAACSTAPKSDTHSPASTDSVDFLATAGSTVGFDDVIDDAQEARVVYVGETHTNPVHHEMQARVVEALWREDPRLSVGMEMFFRPFQAHLDAYVAGEIDEMELLRRTEYFSRWSFDWEFYAPVLRFAREKGIPVVALNIPKEITRKVSMSGIDSLTEEERAEIPELDLTNEEHRRFVRDVFLGGHQMPEERFQNFYTAMCVWDEGMAESAVRFLESPDGLDRRMVVIVGAGHVRHRFGIPDRVERRTGWKQIVLVPIETPSGEEVDREALAAGDDGDYLYLTLPPPVLAPRRLGIMIETESPPPDGIGIRSVTPRSVAAGGGFQAGDVLLEIGGRRMPDLVALRLFLREADRGVSYRTILRRGEERITTAIVFPTKPSHPPGMRRP